VKTDSVGVTAASPIVLGELEIRAFGEGKALGHPRGVKLRKRLGYRFLFVPVVLFTGLLGCETASTVQVQQPFEKPQQNLIRIERCINRTDYRGAHDLEAEATRTLTEKLQESGLFEIVTDAPFVLTCDIERFAEGSAAKRWLVPGWGATQAEVVVMVWEKPGDKVLASFRSETAVRAGGLYTVGADQYILSAVFDDIIKQLRAWVHGVEP